MNHLLLIELLMLRCQLVGCVVKILRNDFALPQKINRWRETTWKKWNLKRSIGEKLLS